jgi:hypothetical protein
MKSTFPSVLATGLTLLAAAGPGRAQIQSFPTPITRILAIGTITQGANLTSVRAILPTEVKETVKLYLAGKIDQWFSLADRNGVVFLLNVTNLEEAHAMLEALPLGQAHLNSTTNFNAMNRTG